VSDQIKPLGYAVQMQDGTFVGCWRDKSIAEHICSKQPASHGDRVVEIYNVDQLCTMLAENGDLTRELASVRAENVALRKENDFLRAHSGTSAKACVYCGLGANEQGKCASGFPGCDRADDQMLCREAGVAMERDELLEANAALRRVLIEVRAWRRTGMGLEPLPALDGTTLDKRIDDAIDAERKP
jgi:hypothetical protein